MVVVLDLVGVRRRYRGAGEVLRGVDLQVEAGSPSVVLGANGSGKSTLLRVAAGVVAPSAGRVSGRASVVGFLPAPFPASSRLSVRAYLRHLAAMRGAARTGAGRAEELLDQLGFVGALEGAVSQLSTGNAQKIGLAQALCASPGLVVLDEPWNGLDTAASEFLDDHLAVLAGSVPLLLADHTGRAARLPGARTYQLRDGVVRDAQVDPLDDREADEIASTARDRLIAPDLFETATTPLSIGRSGGDAGSVIEVWCPDPVHEVLARLPEATSLERRGRRVRVLVARSQCDAWVGAALGCGCSLLLVHHRGGGASS